MYPREDWDSRLPAHRGRLCRLLSGRYAYLSLSWRHRLTEFFLDIPAVRLTGSANEWEGTVEIENKGVWGTVCAEEWTSAEADVVCYQLGYPGASRTARQGEFGQGTGNVILGNVICQVSLVADVF